MGLSPDLRGKVVQRVMTVTVQPGRRGARTFDYDLITHRLESVTVVLVQKRIKLVDDRSRTVCVFMKHEDTETGHTDGWRGVAQSRRTPTVAPPRPCTAP